MHSYDHAYERPAAINLELGPPHIVHRLSAAQSIHSGKRGAAIPPTRIAVDAQGLLLGVLVHAASIRGDGAGHLLGRIKPSYCWLQTVFADSIYNRVATLLACFLLGITLVIVDRIPGTESFVVLPRRRVVEKTFGWLGRWRHLSKDYEHLPEVSEAMVTLPMIRLVLHRVARPNRKRQAATALWLLKRSLSSALAIRRHCRARM